VHRDRLLAAVSALQLTVGLAGLLVAVRRRHSWHFLFVRGRPENTLRDALSMGTALSAPSPMLIAQGVATARLLRRPSEGERDRSRERLVLGGLGVAMTFGYLGESLVRRRLRPAHWDRVDSPIAATGVGLAALMAVVALAHRRP
jgi:hypothetical protein